MVPFLALAMLFGALVCAYLAFRQWTDQPELGGDWQSRLAAMGRQVRSGGDELQRQELQSRLQGAGLRDSEAIDLFVATQLFSVLFCVVVALLVGSFFVQGLDNFIALTVAAVAVGYLAPLQILDARADARRRAIARSLPGTVDLLTSTMEAGLGVDQAIERVAGAIGESDPQLAEEMEVTVREINAGLALDDAMRRLGRRVGLEELQALCAVIAQASVLGARIGQTLRDYSDAARRQRIATLEERAGKLSARLTLPIVFCLLPACLILILAPAVVEAVRVFGDAQ